MTFDAHPDAIHPDYLNVRFTLERLRAVKHWEYGHSLWGLGVVFKRDDGYHLTYGDCLIAKLLYDGRVTLEFNQENTYFSAGVTNRWNMLFKGPSFYTQVMRSAAGVKKRSFYTSRNWARHSLGTFATQALVTADENGHLAFKEGPDNDNREPQKDHKKYRAFNKQLRTITNALRASAKLGVFNDIVSDDERLLAPHRIRARLRENKNDNPVTKCLLEHAGDYCNFEDAAYELLLENVTSPIINTTKLNALGYAICGWKAPDYQYSNTHFEASQFAEEKIRLSYRSLQRRYLQEECVTLSLPQVNQLELNVDDQAGQLQQVAGL